MCGIAFASWMQPPKSRADQSLFPHETPVLDATYACQQTSTRAAQLCRLMAAFFRERVGLGGSAHRDARTKREGLRPLVQQQYHTKREARGPHY